jgi:hypothetical protein
MLLELVPVLEKKHWFACLTSPTLTIRGDTTVCRLLVEHGGVNIDDVDPAVGRTALHHASAPGVLVPRAAVGVRPLEHSQAAPLCHVCAQPRCRRRRVGSGGGGGGLVVGGVAAVTEKAVPLAAHGTTHHRSYLTINRTISNVVGEDEAHQLWHHLFHCPTALFFCFLFFFFCFFLYFFLLFVLFFFRFFIFCLFFCFLFS